MTNWNYFSGMAKAVEEFHDFKQDEILENIEKQIQNTEGQYETAAVITMNESDAYDVYRLLKNRGLSAHYMNRDTSVFKKGITVTTFYLAKGLEFDKYSPFCKMIEIRFISRQNTLALRVRCTNYTSMKENK